GRVAETPDKRRLSVRIDEEGKRAEQCQVETHRARRQGDEAKRDDRRGKAPVKVQRLEEFAEDLDVHRRAFGCRSANHASPPRRRCASASGGGGGGGNGRGGTASTSVGSSSTMTVGERGCAS